MGTLTGVPHLQKPLCGVSSDMYLDFMVRKLQIRLVLGWLLLVGVVTIVGAPADAQAASPQEALSPGALCIAPGPHGFSDVPSGSYFDVAVGWLVASGITTGTAPGTFSPTQSVTRAQMAVFLWRAAGSPTPVGSNGFSDVVANSYYEGAVTWLVGEGITTGTAPGRFSPFQVVTRAQMAVFLWRAAGSPSSSGVSEFTDVGSAAYFSDAVAWLVGEGVTAGTGPGRFSPFRVVTRSQMAVFLWRNSCSSKFPAQELAAGANHTCALKVEGTVACWGANGAGQLGDGSSVTRSSPKPVLGLSAVRAVTAGRAFSCALKEDGDVSCWGDNYYGQLGDGTTTTRLTPTPVLGLSGVVALTAGRSHVCAVKQDSTVACWGDNRAGQLGEGTTSDRLTATRVIHLSGAIALAAGAAHSCALTQDGAVACWGDNNQGQLGDGSDINRLTPTPVQGLAQVTAIAAGDRHSCAVKQDGGEACWGYNGQGELGISATYVGFELLPTPVFGLADVTNISARRETSCAVLNDSTVACWGVNSNGQLGDGTTTERRIPTPVDGLSAAAAVMVGEYHSCALKHDGTVACWGYNYQGQLGDGTTTARLTATTVLGW